MDISKVRLHALADDLARQRQIIDLYHERRRWHALDELRLAVDLFLLRPTWEGYARFIRVVESMERQSNGGA